MPKLTFDNFTACFRKQFIFQTGRSGRRICKYYTSDNWEQGLKNDQWAIIVFIHCGGQYGFSDDQLRDELQIRKSLYEVLKEEAVSILSPTYPDQLLHKKVVTKIGLVTNCVRCHYGV